MALNFIGNNKYLFGIIYIYVKLFRFCIKETRNHKRNYLTKLIFDKFGSVWEQYETFSRNSYGKENNVDNLPFYVF